MTPPRHTNAAGVRFLETVLNAGHTGKRNASKRRIDMLNIQIEKTSSPKLRPGQDALGFGQYFTDHMFVMDYTLGVAGTAHASSPFTIFRSALQPWCSTMRKRALRA